MNDFQLYDENVLLGQLAEGSTAAFDSIYYRYFEAVRANIFKIVRDPEMTDDILQEVFISLWDKRSTFGNYKKISGWLFVASYNRSLNYLRRRATEKLHIAATGLQRDYADDPEQNALQEKQYRLLEEAIATLPPQRKKVFELCRLGGRTYEQAAIELSISKNTVKDHLTHASESIRMYIASRAGDSLHLAYFTMIFLPD